MLVTVMRIKNHKETGMQKRAVLLCRSENGSQAELVETMGLLSSYAKDNEMKVVKIYSETGKLGNLTLWDLRLMAKHKEFEYLLMKDFETFSMPPDESMEEVRYLIENGVEVRTLNDGNLTCESLPTLFRNRFKIFVGKRKYN